MCLDEFVLMYLLLVKKKVNRVTSEKKKLVLASKSPRRIELLKQFGLSFICHPANIDENCIGIFPRYIPFLLAQMKADKVADIYPDCFVLGVDTIISFNGEIIGKPKDIKHALSILLCLSGKAHQVISGVSISKKDENITCTFLDSSTVYFKKINERIITEYFSLINPLDKAGGYAIQEYGDMIIEKVDGSINNIVGLPTEKLMATLNALL